MSESFDKREVLKNILRDNLYTLYTLYNNYQLQNFPHSEVDNWITDSQKIFTQPDFNFRKIKKPLEKIIKKDFPKNILNDFFGKIGNEIESLKSYGEFIVKFAVEKDIAGKGLYEPGKTCFSEEGKGNVYNYNVYEQIMNDNKRYQILLIDNAEGKKVGRCILFYHGNGKIDVMNMYLRVSLPYGIDNKTFFSDIISKYYQRNIIDNSNIASGHCFYQNAGNFTLYLETKGYDTCDSVPKILSNCCNTRIPYNRFQVVEDSEDKNHFICHKLRCENEFYEFYGSRYTCESCENHYEQNDIYEHNGNYYCSDCFNENFFYCEHCDETYSIEDGVPTDNGMLCEDCFNENFFYCSDCNEVVRLRDGIETDNGNICRECFDEKYCYCENCDEVFEISKTVEYDSDNFCKECFSEVYKNLVQDFIKNFQTKVIVQKNLFVK